MVEAPTDASDRIQALDVLRGAALFGVLLVNLMTCFRVSVFAPFLPRGWDPPSATDEAILRAVATFVETKAFILFSLLFGIGLAVQRERAGRRIVRRLAGLLAIGLAHMFLIWNGDVLVLYAVVGLFVTPFLGLRPRFLVLLALACFALQVAPIAFPPPFASLDALRVHVERANDIYGHGTFSDVLAFRFREVKPMLTVTLWSVPRTIGLFFLGAAIARSSWLRAPRDRMKLAAVAALGIGVGAARAGSPSIYVLAWTPILFALGYAAAIVLATDVPITNRAMRLLAPLGRMALTNYLAQSVVLGWIFYGYGLGLFGRIGVVSSLEIAIAIYVVQTIASGIWLRFFRFGPAEWLWRSFTYGARQPFKRRA